MKVKMKIRQLFNKILLYIIMNYGILVNCNLPEDLKNIHNDFLKYLVLNPHITVCYIRNISLNEIENKLSNIKKFKITYSNMWTYH